jgi:hypothetical protein
MSPHRFGSTRMRAAALAGFCLATAAFSGEAPSAPAGAARQGWLQLGLAETTLAGAKVYYEKVLEPNLPTVERGLAKLRDSKARAADLLGRRREILADLNQILGVTDPNVEKQTKLFQQVATLYTQTEMTFYLVRGDTAKNFLRAGGQLPDCTYDRQTNTANYTPRIGARTDEKVPEHWDFAIPVPADRPFDQFVGGTFDMLAQLFGSFMTSTAMHEITELTLLERLRPTDPYFRWFSDGFANAITCVLLEKYLGAEAAQAFAAANDTSKFRELEKELNLRYWMGVSFSVHADRMPVQAENRMDYARYAYAMLEAQRLIQAHGLDCVRRILDAVRGKDSRRGDDILAAIQQVTGEDMEPRLGRYQTFPTTTEGIPKYVQAYQTAQEAKNYEQMFVNVLRIMELRGDVFSVNNLQSFHNAALLLFKMGYAQAGDEVMQNAIALFSKSPAPGGREAAQEAFLLYALTCDTPAKAEKIADELLKTHPTNVSSLTVKMLTSLRNKDLAGAQERARQIRGLAAEKSPSYKTATAILALDPNRPSAQEKAGEPK